MPLKSRLLFWTTALILCNGSVRGESSATTMSALMVHSTGSPVLSQIPADCGPVAGLSTTVSAHFISYRPFSENHIGGDLQLLPVIQGTKTTNEAIDLFFRDLSALSLEGPSQPRSPGHAYSLRITTPKGCYNLLIMNWPNVEKALRKQKPTQSVKEVLRIGRLLHELRLKADRSRLSISRET